MSKITRHICGQCSTVFASEEAYLKHVCPTATVAKTKKGTAKLFEKDILAAVKSARQAKSHA